MLDKLNYIIIGIIAVIIIFVLLLVTGVIPGLKSPDSQRYTLTVWGNFDSKDAFDKIIGDYKKLHRNCEIKYFQKDYLEYERDLISALASGNGPDIFYIHNTWLPKHKEKIAPMPQLLPGKEKNFNYYIPYDYQNKIFVDVAAQDFIADEKIYAIPLYVDTLAIYWNKDIFNKDGVPKPPQTWEEFVALVPKLTKLDEKGNIVESAIAMGGSSANVNRATDILATLMLQGGTDIIDAKKNKVTFQNSIRIGKKDVVPAEQALQFYTDFSNPLKNVYTWNKDMHYYIDAFYEGKTAMMMSYAYSLPTIKQKASRLDFSVAPFPQPEGIAVPITYPSYWGMTVAAASKKQTESWDFLMFVSQSENMKKYLEVTKHPTARRDLITWQKAVDPELIVFLDQALTAKSWYQPDNLAVDRIFDDMINLAIEGKEIEKIVKAATESLTLFLR